MSSPPPEDDGFTSITYKKPSRTPRNRKGKQRAPPRERTIEEKLESRAAALRSSGYLKACRELLKAALAAPALASEPSINAAEAESSVPPCLKPACVVCLGLGSLADSTKAQDQYILLREVLEELDGITDKDIPVEFYDPVFSAEDAAFLTSQGHSVLSAEHPLHLPRPTLLYIPHGPRTLFDALLRANWTSPAQLQRVIILGNRLDLYDDPTYSGSTSQSGKKRAGLEDGVRDELGESAEYVVRAADLFHIVPLPDTKEHLQAFNDLALEWVVPERVTGKDEEFWRREEPGPAAEDKADEAAEKLGELSLHQIRRSAMI
ncbi:hypothetical protein JCM11251_004328 [Rhodosporidiobolus azoricus]